jgi:hypothetical protein
MTYDEHTHLLTVEWNLYGAASCIQLAPMFEVSIMLVGGRR